MSSPCSSLSAFADKSAPLLEAIREMAKKQERYLTLGSDLFFSHEPKHDREEEKGTRHVDAFLRLRLCQWCEQTARECGATYETVEIAMSILDRAAFNYERLLQDPALFGTAGVAALYTASKMNERAPITLDELVTKTDHAVTKSQIVQGERDLLQAVGWLVHPVTTSAFANSLLDLLIAYYQQFFGTDENISLMRDDILSLCSVQTGLAVREYSQFGGTDTLILALAALRNALEGLQIYEEQYQFLLMQALISHDIMVPDSIATMYSVQRRLAAAMRAEYGSTEEDNGSDQEGADSHSHPMDEEQDDKRLAQISESEYSCSDEKTDVGSITQSESTEEADELGSIEADDALNYSDEEEEPDEEYDQLSRCFHNEAESDAATFCLLAKNASTTMMSALFRHFQERERVRGAILQQYAV